MDTKARWRLAHDRQQWVLQRRQQAARPGIGHGIRDSGWRGVSCVGSKKATLWHLFREKGIALSGEAQARFDALPERFMEIISAPERFAAQWSVAA